MNGAVTLIEASSSHFQLSSGPHHHNHHHHRHASRSTSPPPPPPSPQPASTSVIMSTRKRKPIITFQSPDGGVLDMALLIRNTALEFEAAAVVAARNHNTTRTRASGTSSSSSSSSSPSTVLSPPNNISNESSSSIFSNSNSTPTKHGSMRIYAGRVIPPSFRPIALIPRAPHPLYHPLSQQGSLSNNKYGLKRSESGRHAESGALSPDTGRRSSSRTRRPAPKVRETESGPENSKDAQPAETGDKSGGPVKRRRGGVGGGKRKRVEADGDSAYPAVKRSRKRESHKNDADADGDNGNNGPHHGSSTSNTHNNNNNNNNIETSPPSGYSTRARRPRAGAPQVLKDDSGSDGTGSATRTTPVNGAAEEPLGPTKSS